jgi:hypothetical protein
VLEFDFWNVTEGCVHFGWKARLHPLIVKDIGLFFWVALFGSFFSLKHDGHQMLGLKSQRLLSPKQEGGERLVKVCTGV